MSYDFDTTLSPCDHLILRERMIVDPSDLTTLLYASDPTYRMRGTINSEASVVLRIGGVLVPKGHPIYGWNVVKDPLSIGDTDPRKKIVFNRPVRMNNLLIEVDYITIQAHCLKCNGYQRTNDLSIGSSGSFVHITEHSKLLQRVLKFMLTSECAFYPLLTSPVRDYTGRKLGSSLTEEDIAQAISQALNNLKNIQGAQKTVQQLSPQEILKDILGVKVKRDDSDPSRVKVLVQVSSYGKERPAPLAFTLKSNR